MITIRKASERGQFDFGWLKTAHTFSFGEYRDPKHVHFGALCVINDDVVAPGMGFDTHPHRDMEIVTWVLSGALEHKDSAGNGAVLRAGEAQRMTAGRGIEHSERNASRTEPIHLLQVWIFPEAKGLDPGHEQRAFPESERRNRLRLIASPEGRDENTGETALSIHQDVRVYATNLDKAGAATLELRPGRQAWVQVARGSMEVNGTRLGAGDGAAITGETELKLRGVEPAEALVFDLA